MTPAQAAASLREHLWGAHWLVTVGVGLDMINVQEAVVVYIDSTTKYLNLPVPYVWEGYPVLIRPMNHPVVPS